MESQVRDVEIDDVAMGYLDLSFPRSPRDRLGRIYDLIDDPAVVARPGDIVELYSQWDSRGDCYLVAGRLLEWSPGSEPDERFDGPLHYFASARVEVPGARQPLCGWIKVDSPGSRRQRGIIRIDGGCVVGRYERMPTWPIRQRHSYWCGHSCPEVGLKSSRTTSGSRGAAEVCPSHSAGGVFNRLPMSCLERVEDSAFWSVIQGLAGEAGVVDPVYLLG